MRKDPKPLKKFRKAPLFVSLLVLIIACFLFFFLYNKVNKNKQEAGLAQVEWQTEANRREEITSLSRSVKEIEMERESLNSHFAQSSDVVPFLDTIEQLAASVGAIPEITSVDISKDNVVLVVGLKASGNFSAVYKFLMLLENSPYELEFDSVDLQNVSADASAGGKAENAQWKINLEIKLLSFVS
jgi:hypothetical protein